MKTFKCYDCEKSFEASTREEVLGLLYPHYMKEHNEIITGVNDEEKKAWMDKFEKDWASTLEIVKE